MIDNFSFTDEIPSFGSYVNSVVLVFR